MLAAMSTGRARKIEPAYKGPNVQYASRNAIKGKDRIIFKYKMKSDPLSVNAISPR